jgi:predicted heme/steroid binding protein
MHSENLPYFTHKELALRNGTDKEEVWVGFNGVIYDVTRSRLWYSGKHYEHWAGQDLTIELQDAPHTEQVFSRFPKVGLIKKDT